MTKRSNEIGIIMRVLITGVSGFIGRSLWKYLQDKYPSFEVWGVDQHIILSHKNIYKCLLTRKKDILSFLVSIRPDCIVHLAGGRMPYPQQLVQSNFNVTKILFECLEKEGMRQTRVIVPGSAAEYGRIVKPGLVKESDLSQPVSWYGFAKYMQTQLGLFYAQKGFDIVSARLFNILGTGTPAQLAMGKFAKEIAERMDEKKTGLFKTGCLSGRRDYVDINDVCAAFVALMKKGNSGQIYNVCSGKSFLMRTLLKELLVLSRHDIAFEEEKSDFSESYDCVGSFSKIKRVSGWEPKVSIKKSLANTLDFYRE